MRKILLPFLFIGFALSLKAQDTTTTSPKTIPAGQSSTTTVTPNTTPSGCPLNGSTSVQYGQSVTYSFNCLYPDGLTWSVTNGTITKHTVSSVTVLWNASLVAGSYTAYGDVQASTDGTVIQDLPVTITYPTIYAGSITPASQTIAYNTTPTALSCTAASGGVSGGSFTYQWQIETVSVNTWTNISGATSLSYSPGSLANSASYRVIVTQNGLTVNSNTAIVNVAIVPGTISPASKTIAFNSAPGILTCTAARGGSSPSHTYQWQFSTDNTTWSNISGANSLTYTPQNLISTTYYRLMVDGQAYSNVSTLSVTNGTTTPVISGNNTSGSTIDLSKSVGTPKGNASVNQGNAGYSIPIDALPGTNGKQPSIALEYNSGGGTGIAGWGWQLSALSKITRQGQTLYYNGTVSPVTYNNTTDAFALDGQRLFPTSGTNGADGATYGQENENFSKVVSHGGTATAGPGYFTVTTKEGTTFEYGNTADSKFLTDNGQSTMLWLLDKVTDKNGNYETFKYFNDQVNRAYILTEIDYTGNTAMGLSPYNKITFHYALRSDWQATNQYIAGASLKNPYLINEIDVINSSGVIDKSYKCAYSLLNGEYFLKTFTESGSDGSAFNPLTFTYGSNVTGSQQFVSPSFHGLVSDATLYSGNFRGDGTYGIVQAHYTYGSNGSPYYTGYDMLSDFGQYTGQPSLNWDYHVTFPANSTNFVAGRNNSNFNALTDDYDGDGKTDVLWANYTVSGISGNISTLNKIQINYSKRIYNLTAIYTYDSSLYTTMPTVSGYTGTFNQMGATYIIPGDFDGDGAQDYILVLGLSSTQFKAFFNSPKRGIINKEITGFGIGGSSSDPFYANTISSIGGNNIIPMDFDGDGKTDILIKTDSGSYVITVNSVAGGTYSASQLYFTSNINYYSTRMYPGDFNGDGKTDLLVKGANDTYASGNWYIFYSTGTSFNSYPFTWTDYPALNGDGAPVDNLVSVADLNGDGKSDIWQSLDITANGTTQAKHNVYFSEGEPTSGNDASSIFVVQSDTTNKSVGITDGNEPVFGDFNGDGKIDILSIQADSALFVYPEPFKEDHLMTGAVNGLGAQTAFSYNQLNDESGVYSMSYGYAYDTLGKTPGQSLNGNPYNVINAPMYAVSSLSMPDGIGGSNDIWYQYADAVYSPLRGFLGYKQVAALNDATGIQTTSISDINTTYFVPRITEQFSTGLALDTVGKVYFTDTLIPVTSNAGDKRFVHQLRKQINLNGLTGAGSETDNTYDSYGNITTQTVKTGGYSGTTISPTLSSTTTTTYGTYGAAPVPSYPTTVTASSTRSGKPSLSKQTTIAYDSKGNPVTSVDFAGTANAITTTFKFDGFGNDTSTVVSATGVNNRATGITMDAQGRFALTKRQAGSGITKTQSFTYNDWGSPLTQKSSAGLITSIQYDGFNRPKQATPPEGYNITTSYAWESSTGRFSVSVSRPGGGSNTKTWYDILGRAIQKQTSGYNGQNLTQSNAYNYEGQLVSTTKPHYPSETAVTVSVTYDYDNRVTKITTPVNYINYGYSALSGGQYKVTTTNSAGQSSSKTTDATGAIVSSTDNGGTVNFVYDSWGNQLTASAGGKTMITNVYNTYGQKTSATDINMGTYSYQYDALGQLIKQTDPLNHIYNLTYDDFGRLLTKAGTEGTTTYTYYSNTSTGYNSDQVAKITGFSGEETDYTYDNLMRPQTKKITVDGTAYTTTFGYDTYSNPVSVTYPDGLVINSTFDNNGILTQKTMQSGTHTKTLFTASAMNSAGIYTGYTLGNGKAAQVSFDLTAGKPTRYYTPGIQDLNFVFDANTGNLTSRKDAINNLTETFTYDNLNRLTGASLNSVQQSSLQYDNAGGTSFGNIIQKSDAGKYVYNTSKINQVSYITDTGSNPMLPPPNISQNTQQIGYTPFLMTDSVAQNGYAVHFTYAYDDNRIKSVLSHNGVTTETRYYFGDVEKQIKGDTARYIHYIAAGNGITSIIAVQGSTATPYFVYSDYLGSILTVTDSSGSVAAQQNFDAWGRNRNPANWTYNNIPTVPTWLYRGFTGHEMLPQFALINMNGRMYDPVIGKMLAPDVNVPNPYSAIGYNRYDYAFNNPLLYIDPTGNTFASWDEFFQTARELYNSPYGGTATGPTDEHYFESDADAFDAGAAYASEFGLWGGGGNGGGFDGAWGGGSFAPSFSAAQGMYYAIGGKDQNVLYLLQTTFVVGNITNGQWQTSHVFYPGQYTEDANGVATLQWGAGQQGVGAPGFWEGAIPIWGNGRNAVNDFQTGHWGWGIAHSLLAVSDVFLVKSIFTGIAKLGVEAAVDATANAETQTVYRVFGGDARAEGFSWTPVNPTTVSDFRNLAGLPSGGESGALNTADFMLEGTVNKVNIISQRAALPLDGNIGGLPEYIINPENITFTNFSVLKP